MARRNYKKVTGYPGIYTYDNRNGRMYEAKWREPDVATGKRKQKSRSFPTLAEAAAFRKEQVHEVWNENRKTLEKLTLKQFHNNHYMNGYLTNRMEQLTSRKSTESRIHNYILPKLGYIKLQDITPIRIDKFLQNLRSVRTGEEISLRYKLNIFTDLQTLLSYAVDLEYLRSNPCLSKLRPKVPKREKPYLSTVQLQTIFNALAPKELDKRDYRPIFTCFSLTGLRQSEVLGLKWRDYDKVNAELHIVRGICRGQEKATKTDETVRSVHVSAPLASSLAFERHQSPRNREDDYIFCNWKTGRPLDGDNLRTRVLYSALVEAGIAKRDEDGKVVVPEKRGYGFHIFRHTVGTEVARRGGLKAAQHQLGHKDITTTGNIYAHVDKSQVSEEMDSLAADIFDNPSECSTAVR